MATNYKELYEENLIEHGERIRKPGAWQTKVLVDQYSDKTHFVYELLQNAEDAINSRSQSKEQYPQKVEFKLTPSLLEFRHYGSPFSEEDVRAICDIGEGTKKDEGTSIGEHGLGFKSVYQYTNHPEIHSGDEHFQISSFVLPEAKQLLPGETLNPEETLFKFPFDKGETEEKAYDEIHERLQKLDLKTLLFMRNIESISWETGSGAHGGMYLREGKSIGEEVEEVTLCGQKKNSDSLTQERWLVFRKKVAEANGPVGLVEIAFRLETPEDGENRKSFIVRSGLSPLFVFFPTEKETHLGFLIQGPYKTTPNRENVRKDDPWNKLLIEKTSELVVEALFKLREMGHLKDRALGAFVVDLSKYEEENSFLRPIADKLIEALRTEEFIPRSGSGYIAGRNARLARSNSLRKLVSAEQLKDLTGSDSETDWVAREITEDAAGTRRLYEFLKDTIEVEEFGPRKFLHAIDADFLRGQPDDWILLFYEFLGGQKKLRMESWFKRRPILRLSDNCLVTPGETDGKAHAFLPSEEQTEFPTVKAEVCCSEESRQLLGDLGLKEPDLVDDVIHNILPRYPERLGDFPNEFDRDVGRIIRAYQTDSPKRKRRLVKGLKKACWIPCWNAATQKTEFPVINFNAYFPTEELKELFKDNSAVWFVDESRECLQGKEYEEILKDCGISWVLQRREVDCDLPSSELEKIRRDEGQMKATRDSEIKDDYEIAGLGEILQQIELGAEGWEDASLHLWKCICEAIAAHPTPDEFTTFDYQWRMFDHFSVKHPAKFMRDLKEAIWLPGRDGKQKKPADICFEELPEEFKSDCRQEFVDLLRFKPGTLEEAAELLGEDPEFLAMCHSASPEQRKKFEEILAEDTEEPDSKVTDDDSLASQVVSDGALDTDKAESGIDSAILVPVSEGDFSSSSGDDAVSSEGGGEVDNADRKESSRPERPGGKTAEETESKSTITGSKRSETGSAKVKKSQGGSHTAENREGIIKSLKAQLKDASSTGVIPKDQKTGEQLKEKRQFQDDGEYREAVIQYEKEHQRSPQSGSFEQEGYDIDSYVVIEGTERLARRIEVKGKGVLWEDDEIVELSRRQFEEARSDGPKDIEHADDFSYWLYVVEKLPDGRFNVLPIPNPSKLSAHYEFRGGTWKPLAVEPKPVKVE